MFRVWNDVGCWLTERLDVLRTCVSHTVLTCIPRFTESGFSPILGKWPDKSSSARFRGMKSLEVFCPWDGMKQIRWVSLSFRNDLTDFLDVADCFNIHPAQDTSILARNEVARWSDMKEPILRGTLSFSSPGSRAGFITVCLVGYIRKFLCSPARCAAPKTGLDTSRHYLKVPC